MSDLQVQLRARVDETGRTATYRDRSLLPIAVRLLADWDNAEDLLRQHFTLQMGKVAVAAMPSFAE